MALDAGVGYLPGRAVWTNLLQPLLLARVVSAVGAAALLLVGVGHAVSIVTSWTRGGASRTETQLALERRAELVATIVQVSLVLAIVGLVLTVLAADQLAHSVAGAMCAWGVFDSTRSGFAALATSLSAAVAMALWVVFHRLDLRMTAPTLTRGKFQSLFVVAPLVVLDFAFTLAFVLELDLSVVATCCSVSLDGGGGSAFLRGASFGAPAQLGATALALGLAAVVGALVAAWRPTTTAAWVATVLSLGAAAIALPAITAYVAPHAFETPGHACPFCLLHADVGGIGWPLFAATFLGSVLGPSLGVVEATVRGVSEPDRARALQRRLGAWSAGAWAFAVALGVLPAVRYHLATGGASLFGVTG